MALFASGVTLKDELRDPLSAINKKSQGMLQASLGRIGARQAESAKASGRIRGEYAPQELNLAGGRSSRGIEDILSQALGGASYDELQKQKEHERSVALAKRIGELSAPSLLEQILGGISGGTNAAGKFYNLYQSAAQPRSYGSRPSTGSSLNLFRRPSYSTPDFGYFDEYEPEYASILRGR